MANCLAGCIERYASGRMFSNAPDGVTGENFSPFIWAKINNGANYITVGNESYPNRPNKAAIKSIEFGFTNSLEGNIEIIDEEGSELSVFLDSVQKCGEFTSAGTTIEYAIGWVQTNCFGDKLPPRVSPTFKSTISKIDTNLNNGVIRFQVSFTTGDKVTNQFRHDQVFGEEIGGKDMSIEDAISQLAQIPPAINVRYARRNQSGDIVFVDSLKWANHGDKGPKAAWNADSQNKYSAIAKWIEPYRIDEGTKGKGVILLHDPSMPNDLIILEDPRPSDDEKTETEGVGTFIVNGGNCSSVLEFNPIFNFISAMGSLSSGGSTKPFGTDPVVKEDPKSKQKCIQNGNKDVGNQQTVTITQSAAYTDGKNASDEANKSQEAHLRANRLVSITPSPISAELKIVGNTDPRFFSFFSSVGTPISIIVISPNYISDVGLGGGCGDFLKRTDCHPIFSNKSWMLMGLNHSVRDGSYVTTLKVILPAPSIDLCASSPLGGNDTGAQLKNTC